MSWQNLQHQKCNRRCIWNPFPMNVSMSWSSRQAPIPHKEGYQIKIKKYDAKDEKVWSLYTNYTIKLLTREHLIVQLSILSYEMGDMISSYFNIGNYQALKKEGDQVKIKCIPNPLRWVFAQKLGWPQAWFLFVEPIKELKVLGKSTNFTMNTSTTWSHIQSISHTIRTLSNIDWRHPRVSEQVLRFLCTGAK